VGRLRPDRGAVGSSVHFAMPGLLLLQGSMPFPLLLRAPACAGSTNLQSLVDRIGVDDAQVRIKRKQGPKCPKAELASRTDADSGSQMSTRWCAGRDSNP
jgi:hypothetical protein